MNSPSIHINLEGLPTRIQRSLQSATNLVAIGLNAPTGSPAPDAAAGGIQFRYATNEPWTSEKAQQEWVRWILLNGFRDAAESLSEVLEEARLVAAIWRLQLLKLPEGGITLLDWQEAVAAEGRRFHRFGLPDKIQSLSEQYGVTVEPALLEQLLSINRARNCLVHRGGVISEMDRNSASGFELSWRATVAIAQGPDGEREVVPPVELQAGEGLAIATKPRRKQFVIGDGFTITSEEFAQICWTMFLFVQALTKSLEEVGRGQGILFTEPPPA